jgi:hypothetical protein
MFRIVWLVNDVVPVGVVPDIGLAAQDATQRACVFVLLGGLAADAAGTMTAAPMMSAIPLRTADS